LLGAGPASWLPEDRVGRWKIAVLVLALAALAILTFFSVRQPAPPQFVKHPTFLSREWWLLPHEQNSALRPGITDQLLASVNFATPQLGWAVGTNGTILHTEDGGKSWNVQPSKTIESVSSVSFVTPQLGWAVGTEGTILHTQDGGKSWNAQASNTSEWLYSVSFTTPQLGWAVGTNGTILRTQDGGKSWNARAWLQSKRNTIPAISSV
jgi:hypothetical protein